MTGTDNQGRNLAAAKKHFDYLAREREEGEARVAALPKRDLAEWTVFEGVDCLRVGDSHYVAVPVSGRKNARKFDVIDVSGDRSFVCQLNRSEVFRWLRDAAV